MDIDDDGNLDILSGSYSRMETEMAGLFQVLYGNDEGGFEPAKVLNGTDGEPLIAPGEGQETFTDRICTRPTAVDLNDDGLLDIVTGNFAGTFYFFEGEENGFAPEATLMTGPTGALQVATHSDPFFVDWDGDGDLDLLSGSGQGGVFLFENTGSVEEPSFGSMQTLLPPAGYQSDVLLGDAHITGPQAATRLWVDDVDEDGKLDLLIGDNVTVHTAAEGLDESTVREKLAVLDAEQAELMRRLGGEQTEEAQQKWQADYQALNERRQKVLTSDATGFVWLLKGK